jgi:hypothetical protein
MIQKLTTALAALVVLSLALVGWADVANTNPTKFSQIPDMTCGWNLQSQWDAVDGEPNIIRADNWLCTNGLPVTDIHWWGSYFFNSRDNENPDIGGPVDKFEISIFANGANSLPSDLMYRQTFGIADVNETYFGTDNHGEDVYQYFVDLSPEYYFEQEQGEIYWLSIVALTEGAKRWPMWGWHTAESSEVDELLGSAQTTKDLVEEDASVGGGKKSNPWQPDQYDLAFELTTIPEPSLVALFGLGMFVAWRRFRRQ